MSPAIKKFTKDSIIFFKGDVDKNIYILKNGKVVLKYTPPDSFKEEIYQVKDGEFFGLKSSIGHYPREETALCITDVITVVLSENEFINLISKNTTLLIKILKILSKELRDVALKVYDLLGGTQISSEEGMLNYGKYYFDQSMYQKSLYFYKRFTELFPDSPQIPDAQKKVKLLKEAIESGSQIAENKEKQKEDKIEKEENSLEVKMYYEALNLFSQEKYHEAITEYKKLLELEEISDEYKSKALFEIGRSFFKLNQFDKSIAIYKKLLTEFEDIPIFKEVLYELALTYTKVDKFDKAKSLLQKVIKVEPQDNVNIKAKRLLSKLKDNKK